MENLCPQQLIRSASQYQSFPLAGIVIAVTLLVIIIITSWTSELRFRRRSYEPGGPKRYKRIASACDRKLQVLPMVLQGADYDGWEYQLDETPTDRQGTGRKVY